MADYGYVPTDIRILWPYDTGTYAIPTGFERDTTNFDELLLRGAADSDDAGGTGGATTHTHSATNHSHSASSAHTHDVYSSSDAGSAVVLDQTGPGEEKNLTAPQTHSHASTPSAGTLVTYQSATGLTSTAQNNKPNCMTIIFIKRSSGSDEVFPEWGCGLYDDNFRGGVTLCDDTWAAARGTDGGCGSRYLIGAAEPYDSGDDETYGGTFVGPVSTQHNHGGTSGISHTHTANSHSHITTPALLDGGGTELSIEDGGVSDNAYGAKHHGINLRSTSTGATDAGYANVGDGYLNPIYVALRMGYKSESGAGMFDGEVPDGMILPWVGTLASVPADFDVCDGTNGTYNLQEKTVYCTESVGNIGTTGGVDSHTHTCSSHSHTHSGTHDHTTEAREQSSAEVTRLTGSDVSGLSNVGHSHNWTISSESNGTTDGQVIVLSTEDNIYSYREVIWVRKRSRGKATLGSIHRELGEVMVG